ncbi:uncharacterized protein [Dysidea avara]|uniref:uncharacterized protein isoform X2 n=1 Tax=Dysidea avara TaxID=196820 RepID=UPI0033266515
MIDVTKRLLLKVSYYLSWCYKVSRPFYWDVVCVTDLGLLKAAGVVWMALASQSLVTEWLLARSILGKKSGARTKRDVDTIIPWLRERGDIFAPLPEAELEDLAQNIVLSRFHKNMVISQQGDTGDSLYFILRGTVTTYLDSSSIDKTHIRESVVPSSMSTSYSISSKRTKQAAHCMQKGKCSYGAEIRCLTSGSYFNESSVVTRDSTHLYTTIANEQTDCILIGRALFNRTLSEQFKVDIMNKLDFITTSMKCNSSWSPGAIMHLALSLWEESFPFDSKITTEGKEISSFYAIKSGVVKLSVDSSREISSEVLSLISPPQNYLGAILSQSKEMSNEGNERQRRAHAEYHYASLQHSVEQIRKNHSSVLKNKTNICVLGPGDFVGSTEALFGMKYSNFTAVCDSPVIVYCLDHVNFQVWINKRYPSSARHMHLVNHTILLEWTNRLQGAAILSCLLALTKQKLAQILHKPLRRDNDRTTDSTKDGYTRKQLVLRIARSVTTFLWTRDEINKLTRETELTDSAFFSQPFMSSCFRVPSSSRWKADKNSRPFTAPAASKLALSSGVLSVWSFPTVDRNRSKHSHYCFDHPPRKPLARTPPCEALPIPVPSPYPVHNDQDSGVNWEESCKLDQSISTGFEVIHDNSTSLTTVSSLPDHSKTNVLHALSRRMDSGYSKRSISAGTVSSFHRFSSLSDDCSVFGRTPELRDHSNQGSRAEQLSATIVCRQYPSRPYSGPAKCNSYPATPANSPVKRTAKSASNRQCTQGVITSVLEETAASSYPQTLVEEMEEENSDPQSSRHKSGTQACSQMTMQNLVFPQSVGNKLQRPKKSPACLPNSKPSKIPHPSMNPLSIPEMPTGPNKP